ncbi:LysR family transcriptional regulator [Streptomyces sp. NPDC090499]|uniref:LysR family transcriptional regulator n=1 Tax=Streptomyces sp. NPDC090499 TaxID=3365965 RepID=UPI00381E4B20
MELLSLDLNLVVVLHAILEERSVTRAGKRVGLTQPGASAALARLRRHFDDQLLVREGGRYELTPLAEGLREELGEVIEHLRLLLAARPGFDPSLSERAFVLQCSDATLEILGPALVHAVAAQAPRVRLDFRPINEAVIGDTMGTLRAVDLLIVPRGLVSLPDVPSADVYTDRWVCLTWRGNETVGDRLTEAEARSARWIMPYRSATGQSLPADAGLAPLGIDRQWAVRVENFTAPSKLLPGTNLLALVHERTHRQYPVPDLRELELPVPLPAFTEAAWWHPSKARDPGHRWLLDVLLAQAATLGLSAGNSTGWRDRARRQER